SLRTGDDFDQLQVAWWIKEVCTGPMLLELFGHAFGDEVDGKTRSVCGDDGAGFAELRNAREKFAFYLEIFRHDFNDPIGFGDAREIVFKVADGNSFGERGSEKSGGAGFFRSFEASADDFVAVGGGGIWFEVGRGNVEKNAGKAGIGEMRGDAC